MTRDQWLMKVADGMRPAFLKLGLKWPRFRVSIGFTSTGRRGHRIGECHAREHSGDKTYELFIRPDLDDPHEVSGVLAHELVHAAIGLEHRHGPEFRRVALGLGLVGQMRSTRVGPDFQKMLVPILKRLGDIPHAALELGGATMSDAPPKQSARLIKCECRKCGYKARVARIWIDDPALGPPHCPKHGAMEAHE
jgi:hypothetical protein